QRGRDARDRRLLRAHAVPVQRHPAARRREQRPGAEILLVTRSRSRWTPAGVAVALALALSAAPAARADGERIHQGRLIRVAAGPASLHEGWHPSGGPGDAVHTGWGPALGGTLHQFGGPG